MEKLFEEFSPKTLRNGIKNCFRPKRKNYESLIWKAQNILKVAPVNQESITKLKGDITHNHSDWEIEQSLNKPTNKEILACLNGGASALLLKDVPSQDLEAILENVLIQYIHTSLQSKSIESSIDILLRLIEKRSLDKNSIKGSIQ